MTKFALAMPVEAKKFPEQEKGYKVKSQANRYA
jgi:hypothetical protein